MSNEKLKITIAVAIFALVVFVIGAETVNVAYRISGNKEAKEATTEVKEPAKDTKKEVIQKVSTSNVGDNRFEYYHIYVDTETGVQYLFTQDISINSGGLCPMYNADGTLKLYQEGE